MANIRLFEHSNIAGRQLFIASPHPERYVLAPAGFLESFEFNDITSSVRLGADPEDGNHTCFLFENNRFDGQFRAYAFKDTRNIISLPYFNDLTSSVILVSHDPTTQPILVGLRQSAGEQIDLAVDQQLNSFPELKRNGPVSLKFSIDAYEIGHSGRDLIKISIPLEVSPSFPYRHYQVNVIAYVALFINEEHVLMAEIKGISCQISAGLLSGIIEKKIKRYIRTIARLIDGEINQVLHEFKWLRWKDVYLLPGLTTDLTKDYDGNVEDDCTVVLVPLK